MSTLHQASARPPDAGSGGTALLTPRRLAFGGAIVVVLLALAVVAASLIPKAFVSTQPPARDFNLASATSAAPPLLLIRFSAQATQPQIAAFLGTYRAEVVSGPRRGNFYDIRITGEPSAADVSAIVRKMQDETELVDLVAEKE